MNLQLNCSSEFPASYHRLIGLVEERIELWWEYRCWAKAAGGLLMTPTRSHDQLVDDLNTNNQAIRDELQAMGASQ